MCSSDLIEIEVADSGPAALLTDVEPAVQSLLEQVGGRLTAAACPEGGRALTLRLPHRRLRRRAA